MDQIVGIGEFKISGNQEDCLKTLALASCVAMTLYSPRSKVAGMIHIALPKPPNEEETKNRPAYYGSTGVPLLISRMCIHYGCNEDELQLHLYGGANSIRKVDYFQIGPRNIEAVLKSLSELKLKTHHREVGGTVSRTLEMEVATGFVKVLTQPITI